MLINIVIDNHCECYMGVYDVPVKNGIDGGRITNLRLFDEGKMVAKFQDTEWVLKPLKNKHKQIINALKDLYSAR